ncbi:hypothetical protein [Glycomyces dulcitolivorans]|uniref:hypothetical protein n=1 Tax=Glycomyces dulcitolivorans TaxID=2200759 RepID=UPI000DD4BA7B|nr:hypothetical protein [Glycomyces dulcitolivorans]
MNDALTYDGFTRAAIADPAVVGLLLIGSHAHEGLPNERSDHDLWVVIGDGAESDLQRLQGYRSSVLDLEFFSPERFRAAAGPGYWRYTVARGRVLLDRLDGGIAAIVAAAQRLGAEESRALAAERLDDYVNMLYRSVKNHRDGRLLASRLDAAESLGYLLELLFAMDRRPRPYNKHLEWELERFPLPDWQTARLLEALSEVLTGDVGLQRRLFVQVEEKARAAGHGDVLDGWGAELDLLR